MLNILGAVVSFVCVWWAYSYGVRVGRELERLEREEMQARVKKISDGVYGEEAQAIAEES